MTAAGLCTRRATRSRITGSGIWRSGHGLSAGGWRSPAYLAPGRAFRWSYLCDLRVAPALVVNMPAASLDHDARVFYWAVIRPVIFCRQDPAERHPQVARQRPVQQELLRHYLLDSPEVLTV